MKQNVKAFISKWFFLKCFSIKRTLKWISIRCIVFPCFFYQHFYWKIKRKILKLIQYYHSHLDYIFTYALAFIWSNLYTTENFVLKIHLLYIKWEWTLVNTDYIKKIMNLWFHCHHFIICRHISWITEICFDEMFLFMDVIWVYCFISELNLW